MGATAVTPVNAQSRRCNPRGGNRGGRVNVSSGRGAAPGCSFGGGPRRRGGAEASKG